MVGLTFLVRWVEWVGGWLEIWRAKLISTQVLVEVEVGVELGNTTIMRFVNNKDFLWMQGRLECLN